MIENHFGEDVAARYDDPELFDPAVVDPAVELRERWSGWGRDPFTSERQHVSIWEKRIV